MSDIEKVYEPTIPDDFWDGKIVGETEEGYLVLIPKFAEIKKHNIKEVMVKLRYSGIIEEDQRKKAWALIGDILEDTGRFGKFRTDIHNLMKKEFCELNGIPYFSLSNCSRHLASRYINFLINHIIENNINSEHVQNADFDESMEHMFYARFMSKKCMICDEEHSHLITKEAGTYKDKEIFELSGGEELYFLCNKHFDVLVDKGEKMFQTIYHLKPFKISVKALEKFKGDKK